MSFKRSFTSEKSTPRSKSKSTSTSPKAEMASAAKPRTSLSATTSAFSDGGGFSDFGEEVGSSRFKGAAAEVMSPVFGQAGFPPAFDGFAHQARDAKAQTFGGAFFGSLPMSTTAEPVKVGRGEAAQKSGGKYALEVVAAPSKSSTQPTEFPSFIETMAPYSTLCTVASADRVTAALRRMLVDSATAGRVDYTPLKEAKDSEYARDRAEMESEFLAACTEVYVGRVFSDLRALAASTMAGDVCIGGSQFQISVIVGQVAGREQCCIEVKRTQGEAMQHGWLLDEVRRALGAAGMTTCSLCDASAEPATLEDVTVLAADLARDTRLTADVSDSATTVDDFDFLDVSYELDLGDIELPADTLTRSDGDDMLSGARMSDKDIETFGDFFVDAGTQVAEWLSILLDDSAFHELRKNAAIDLAAELLSDATRPAAVTALIGECDDSLDALLAKLLSVCATGDRYGCDAFTTRAVLMAMSGILSSLDAPNEVLQGATMSELRKVLPRLSEFWQAPKRAMGSEWFYFIPSKQIERECDQLLASIARA